jgi:hypothetical protein
MPHLQALCKTGMLIDNSGLLTLDTLVLWNCDKRVHILLRVIILIPPASMQLLVSLLPDECHDHAANDIREGVSKHPAC